MSIKRAVIVGIPGVGKTTVIRRAHELIVDKGVDADHVVFGTIMFNEAKKLRIENRDQMRTLPMGEQKQLQIKAASTIAHMPTPITLIDTHLFIRTREGYMPGLPHHILTALAPTNLILIEAAASDVISRRSSDKTRSRDILDPITIERENELARSILAASSVVAGCPILIVKNEENLIDSTAEEISQALIE